MRLRLKFSKFVLSKIQTETMAAKAKLDKK